MKAWPDSWSELTDELRSARGGLAMVDTGSPAAPRLLQILGAEVEPVSIGQCFARADLPEAAMEMLRSSCGDSALLYEIDALFSPQLNIEPLMFISQLSRRRAIVTAWPGRIAGGRLSYSLPGRADHFDEPARDILVLRPVSTDFPDEVPYTVERYPA